MCQYIDRMSLRLYPPSAFILVAKISANLETARLRFIVFQSLWNLTNVQWQWCCRNAGQISKRYANVNISRQSRFGGKTPLLLVHKDLRQITSYTFPNYTACPAGKNRLIYTHDKPLVCRLKGKSFRKENSPHIAMTSHGRHGISNHRWIQCMFYNFLRLTTKRMHRISAFRDVTLDINDWW